MMRHPARTMAALLTALAYGCSPSISRYGYTLDDVRESARDPNCAVAIKAKAGYEKREVRWLGGIRARPLFFTVDCDEASILRVFSQDACALGAHVVSIMEETQPDFSTHCYRAEADLLQLKDDAQATGAQSDPRYEHAQLDKRVRDSSERSKVLFTMAIIAGITGGLAAGAVAARNP